MPAPTTPPQIPAADGLPLRDLHLPDPVSAWPPAPGWWVLALVGSALLGWLLWLGYRRWQRQRPLTLSRRAADQALDHCWQQWQQQPDSSRLVSDINQTLKRFCRLWQPQACCLSGDAWSQYLQAPQPLAEWLASAAYRPHQDDIDAPALLAFARRWLQQQTLPDQRPDQQEDAV